MKLPKTSMMLAAAIAYGGAASAQTTFVFESEDSVAALNGLAAGTLSADGITLSASATAPEFAVDALGVASLTGETVAANLFVDAGNGIGVDNPTIENDAFEAFTAGPAADDTEGEFITGEGESLVLSFDQAVIINAFNFFGVGNDETLTVTVSSLADAFSFESSGGSDNNVDPFGEGFELAAGETISFGSVVNSAGEVARYSLETITVTAVPEPASLALLGLSGLAIAGRRRRA